MAVLFGGRSVEHEVSVISGHQAMDALDQAGFPILPIYITKQGDWYAGEGLHNLDLYREQTFHAAGLKNVHRVSLSPDRSIRQLVVHPGAGGGLLAPTVVVGGRVVGVWRRTLGGGEVTIDLSLFGKPAPRDRDRIVAAAERYGAFLGLQAKIV